MSVPERPAGPVLIEPMRRRHLRAVLRIEAQAPQRGWSLGLYLSELSRPEGRRYLVARAGGSVVGFAGMLRSAGDGHVTTIAVDPAWQGRRIGSRLLYELVRWAQADGATALTLEVRAGNEAAIALYRRFGFAPAGVRRNYYADIGEDALVMWANDIDGPDYARLLDAAAQGLGLPAAAEGVG